MIEKRLQTSHLINSNISTPVLLRVNMDHFIKISYIIPEEYSQKLFSFDLLIHSLNKPQVPILQHKFVDNCFRRFNTRKAKPLASDLFMCGIFLTFSIELDGIIFIEVDEIKNNLINALKISHDRKDELFNLIYSFLNEEYEETINKISIFGEFVTIELASKIKNKKLGFKNAIETLTHHKISERAKINYNYLGFLLSPIYYIRNQKLHPYSKFTFDKSIAELLFTNLSRVIEYLSMNQIKL